MTLGNVIFGEVDGQLGLVNSGQMPLAIAGTSISGSLEAQSFTRVDDIVAEYVSGDLVEAGAVQLKDYPEDGAVILCRVSVAAAGTATLVTTGWVGTSVPSVRSAGLAPAETAEYRVLVEVGGTLGTAGVTYKVSLDAGNTYGASTALGTATEITLDASKVGTLVLDFAAGTIEPGVLLVRTVAAAPTAAEVSAAVDKLGNNITDWDCLEVSCPIDATIADAVQASVASMRAREKERYWWANGRLPTPGETVAAYKTAMGTAWGSFSTTMGLIVPGDFHFVSRVDGRKMRRPRVWAIAPYVERLPRDVDPSDTDNGPLPGVTITDGKGNPELHDERVSPGFDDMKLVTAYSKGTDGVYIGNARLKSPAGSDYKYVQHRRVMNAGKRALRSYLNHVLNKGVMVSTKTGLMLPSYVRRIKKLAETAVGSVLGVGPMVSGFAVNPDGNVNIISTETLPVDFEITPKGYVKAIVVRVLFKNPVFANAA